MGSSVAARLKGGTVRAIFFIGPSCKSPGRWIFSSRLLYRKPLQIGPFKLFLSYGIAELGYSHKNMWLDAILDCPLAITSKK